MADILNSLLAANFNTLFKISEKQFSQSTGLHLNSKDWKPYIAPGVAKFYNFLMTGAIRTKTTTKTNSNSYEQVIQFSEYKKVESTILLLLLNEVPENEIVNFMATFLFNTRTKVFCTCPAFKFWGFEYILTRKKSVFGPGEYRYPVEKNPNMHGVFCKHLWVIASSLQKKQLKLAEGLVPFYKRVYGVNSKKNFEKLRREYGGVRGIKELFQDAKENVISTKNAQIRDAFNSICSKYFTSTGRKKYKEPEVMDQKTEKKSKGLEPMMRGINRINKKYAGEENTEGLDMETLRGLGGTDFDE